MDKWEALDIVVERYARATILYYLNKRDGYENAASIALHRVNVLRTVLARFGWTEAKHDEFMAETERQVSNG